MYFPPELSLFLQQCLLGVMLLQLLYSLVLFLRFHFHLVCVISDSSSMHRSIKIGIISCLLCLENLGYVRADTLETVNKHFYQLINS